METVTALESQDHMRNRSMWMGSFGETSSVVAYVNNENELTSSKEVISEALFKTLEEILTNAVDTVYRGPKQSVKLIEGRINCKQGWFEIIDDGDGMPVHTLVVDGREMYSVEALFTRLFTGTNFDDVRTRDKTKADKGGEAKTTGDGAKTGDRPQDSYRVTGGINGVGLKVVAANASKLTVRTLDSGRGLAYEQTFVNGVPEAPKVRPAGKDDPRGTSVKFWPDQKNLCGRDNWLGDDKNAEVFKRHANMRFRVVSAFVDFVDERYVGNNTYVSHRVKPRVVLNNREIKMEPQDFSRLATEMKPVAIHFRRNVPMVVSFTHRNRAEVPNVHVVNGVFVRSGGSHVDVVIGTITERLFRRVVDYAKKTFAADVTLKAFRELLNNDIHMTSMIQIPVPSFQSQTKDAITLSEGKAAELKAMYQPTETDMDRLFELLKPKLEEALSGTKRNMAKAEKYVASRSGKGKSLFLPEGDTAAQLVDKILTYSKVYNRSNSGYYTTKGVVMNVLKNSKKIGDRVYMKKSLEKNVFFMGLLKILRLDVREEYYCGPDPARRAKGDAAYKSLRYEELVLATDQDLDGIGQICSLVLIIFCLYWPNLIKRGFVKRLSTPVIRVYGVGKNSGKCMRFYDESEFDKWYEDEKDNAWGKPQYYKGLGGHSPSQVKLDIVPSLAKTIMTFVYDDEAEANSKIFYGNLTADRKTILSDLESYRLTNKKAAEARSANAANVKDMRGYAPRYASALTYDDGENNTVTCSNHFRQYAAEFQAELIHRNMCNMNDGMPPTQRKVFTYVRRSKAELLKVFQLGGGVAKKMNYHHGDASMNMVIIKMSQFFWGGNRLPLLLPHGLNGSIKIGRDAGQPRYLSVRYNKRLCDVLFPPDCDPLLDYVVSDGDVVEPTQYVPIYPYFLAVTTTQPAAGFKSGIYARDHDFVYGLLVDRIEKEGGPSEVKNFPSLLGHPWIPDDCEVRVVKDVVKSSSSSKGIDRSYEVCTTGFYPDGDDVVIYSMPPKMWTNDFKRNLLNLDEKLVKKKDADGKRDKENVKYVKDVFDDSDVTWNVRVTLEPGGVKKINDDPEISAKYGLSKLEYHLGMFTVMRPEVNMTDERGRIRRFDSYEQAMDAWYLTCRKMYDRRICRQLTIHDVKMSRLRNMLRYIEEEKRLKIDGMKQKEREEVLVREKFDKIASINGIEGMTTAELSALTSAGDYDYLMNITVGMKSEEKIAKMREAIEELAASKAVYARAGYWREMWLGELKKYKFIVDTETKANWHTEDDEDTKYE